MTIDERYDVFFQVTRPRKMAAVARKLEPRELFAAVIDALVADGWRIDGTVRVNPRTPE